MMNKIRPHTITKILSKNDTGETGAHQAGILIPKEQEILSFFPDINASVKNPRHYLTFTDDFDEKWTFAFIYYNNTFFGGTRNEYRLTRMTPFIRNQNLKSGDEITLMRDNNGFYFIKYQRIRQDLKVKSDLLKSDVLILGTGWKVIKIKKNGSYF